MGLFSSKYETYVGTSISSFGDAKEFVSSKKKGVISSIAKNSSMPNSIMNALVNSAGFKAKGAFKYGGDGYIFGRPNDTVISLADAQGAFTTNIQLYLTTILNAQEVYYAEFGTANYFHEIYQRLYTAHNFNFATGELPVLSASKGSLVTLHELGLLVQTENYVDNLGSFVSLDYYPYTYKENPTPSRVGADMTYRWNAVTVSVASPVVTTEAMVVESTTVTSPYTGGNANTSSTVASTVTTVLPTVVVVTSSPAVPPAIYAAVSISTSTVTTLTKDYSTLSTYVANAPGTADTTGVLTVRVERTDTYSAVATTTTTTPTQETALVAANISFSPEQMENQYGLAAYRDASGNQAFLTYQVGGGIAELENTLTTSYSTPGDYLPRLYFRWNAVPSNADLESDEYRHSKKMAKKMGIAYDDAIEGIHSLEGGRTAADLADVKSVFMMYGVQADASSQIELQYLYKHFENWYGVIGGKISTQSLAVFNADFPSNELFETVLVLEDTRFKMTLGMQGIWKRTVTGVIGAVGTYASAVGTLNSAVAYEYYLESSVSGTTNTTYPWHCYRYQTTSATYIEYQVVGLTAKYYVEGQHAAASGWTEDVADPKDILYVPVNYTLVQTMKVFEQEELMYKSMHIVANSLVIVKVKWYQQDFWGFIFKAIAFYMLVTGFVAGFEFLYAVTAIASVSLVWAMELLYTALLEMLITTAAATVFVNIAGEELAFLAALVATIYGYGSKAFQMGMPYVQQMLAYSNAVFKEIASSFQDQLEDTMAAFADFQKEAKEQMDALNVIKDALVKPSALGKLYIGESSEDFYARTIHAGNVGTRVYDLQTNYVDLALALPRTFNTLEV